MTAGSVTPVGDVHQPVLDHLDRLTDDLDKGELSFQPGQRWAEVHPRYVEAFGPEASAIGPPPGY